MGTILGKTFTDTWRLRLLIATATATMMESAPGAETAISDHSAGFFEAYCASCHNDVDKEAGLDLTNLKYDPTDRASHDRWVRIHDRLAAGEMPPKEKRQPGAAELEKFLNDVARTLVATEQQATSREGRATRRRLNGYEYENALRDLLSAPWLQIKGQFPDDGEAHRFNKIADALDVSHVHMARYMSAADYAMRQVMSVQFARPPTTTTRYYARDQRTLTSKFTGSIFNSSPDRMTFPVLGTTPQPEVRWRRAPLSVGPEAPETREQEAVGWVSSNYVTGFTYRWDEFRAPVAGRYRIRFSGYTLWVAPGGVQMRFANEQDRVGTPRPPNPNVGDYDRIFPGRRHEPITVYTRNGVMNRRVGEFDLTPEPAVYDLGEVWLLANETLVPDASRFYRSRPNNFRNPLMTPEGAPAVAFRWMEVEGPLYDSTSGDGYRLLFGDLPLRRITDRIDEGVAIQVIAAGEQRDTGRNAGQRLIPMEEVQVEVVSNRPAEDARRLIANFLARAYGKPVAEEEVGRFVGLFDSRQRAGLSFTESILAAYTAVLASPRFVFLEENPGRLDSYALAKRLSLFLWNSLPDDALLARAARDELARPEVLREEAERLLAAPQSQRFIEAFLDYWLDLRKIGDSTPSTTLYNDYYLDDALTEAAIAETRLYFEEMLRRNLSVRNAVASDFTFLNERLAAHYGIEGVRGVGMRRVTLSPDSVRGGFMTQASVLKVTANGTTTSPVLRGKWIVERILGIDIPPPPPVAAVEPDIRGAVTIRQQLEKHRDSPSCASCHNKMDPPGFALESFDVMGGWRDRYRAIAEGVQAVRGLGKNGQPYEFHLGPPVDSAGKLPDGRRFAEIREFKRLLETSDVVVARNLAKQLLIFATGAPIRFSDRKEVDRIVAATRDKSFGLRSLVLEIVRSDVFLTK
jgi:hypothetical protein